MNEFNYTSLIGEHKRDVKDGLSLKIKNLHIDLYYIATKNL